MKRNAITGEYTFNGEEFCDIALGISARCEDTLQWYRTAVANKNSGTAEYFANGFKAASKLYKEVFGTDYYVDIAEGPVPTADTKPDSADSTNT